MTGSRPVRPGTRHLLLLDVALAVAVTLSAGFEIPVAAPVAVTTGWLVALALGLQVAGRRRCPNVALWGGAGVTVAALLIGVRADVAVLALALAAYPSALAVAGGRSVWRPILLLAAVPPTGLLTLLVPQLVVLKAPTGAAAVSTPLMTTLYGWLILGASWVLARAVRARRVHAAEVLMLCEREAVTEERLRIAREVHDVVGHSLGLITTRAGIANHLADTHPEEGRAALTSIETISREALAEVRAVLTGLHDPCAVPAVTVERLVAGARAAGVPVHLTCPDLATVPTAVRESAQRIVQEALTNVLRHTRGPAQCRVEVVIDDSVLRVVIVDAGPALSPVAPAGHGLHGVRERVAQHRGSAVLGPREDGGFEVRAQLPFEAATPRG